ncbi:MAG TPA: 5-(carboxyamino)imidazole ribonucleotide synthase [Pyrinomonadaceae bacterium]|jgi:5-(carboxyamino)imidazole ribonucleotide synthase|nr:5-(carboxyamino)imidazole ribonucleotide synthase [Pyrinomonadaceae bacterium]
MKPVLPGANLGVLGSGQLGRMFAIAARRMGYRVHTFSPDSDTPTGQVADKEYERSYDDLDAVREFARGVEVVTFEFENVPARCVEAASQFAPVRPGGRVLHTTQHRLREKTFLAQKNFPIAAFRRVTSAEHLRAALSEIGYPAILKTAGFGYDGKGQTKISSAGDIEPALNALGGREAVVEAFVDFEREVSVVAARGLDGEFAHYGVIENAHRRHILDLSIAPAPKLAPAVEREAVEIARSVLEVLDVVGVMCVEFFLTRDGKLLINELAPRPHNSGHLTFDASVTSQFEQQLRAVCGLPLGSTALLCPAAAMANLLGELWQEGREPDWRAALAYPEVKLHLYGKLEPRTGRKMGHLTALAANAQEAARTVVAARAALMQSGRP